MCLIEKAFRDFFNYTSPSAPKTARRPEKCEFSMKYGGGGRRLAGPEAGLQRAGQARMMLVV
jgi:hypothetical protein